MHLDQPGDHLALALTHGWHVDFPVILGDSEFLASAEVRGDFGAMDDILARKTGDVGARTSDIFSLNDGSLHPLPGQCPGDVFARFAAAQHEEIVFFRLRGWCIHAFSIAPPGAKIRSGSSNRIISWNCIKSMRSVCNLFSDSSICLAAVSLVRPSIFVMRKTLWR